MAKMVAQVDCQDFLTSTRYGRLLWCVLPLLVLAACGKGSHNQDSPLACLPNEAVGLVVSADPATVRLTGGEPATVQVRVTPVFAGGVSVPAPAVGSEAYSLDITSDGKFDVEFRGRTTSVTLTEVGTYPMQVQTLRCNDEALVGRVQVAAFATKPPVLTVTLTPGIVQGLLLGTAVDMQINATDPDGGSTYDVWWSWQDGIQGLRRGHRFAQEGSLLSRHVFATRGRFKVRAAVTDAQGDVAEFEQEVFVTSALVDLLDIQPGAFVADLDAHAVSDVTFAAEVAVAAGRAGVLLYRADTTEAVLQSRFLLQPTGNVEALAVRMDPIHRVVYGAGGEDGLYFWDVTDLTRPRPLFPFRFFPTVADGGETNYNLDRVWICRDGRWIWIRDGSKGVYLLELTAPTLLDGYRVADPGAGAPNPYVERILGGVGAAGPMIVGDVEDLYCVGDRYVGVAADAAFRVVDMQPYLDTITQETPDPPVEVVFDLPTQAPGIEAKALAVAAVMVTDAGGRIDWNVALGQHGWAEVTMTHDASGIKHLELREHFYYYRIDGNLQRIYNLVGDVARDGNWLFVPAFDFGKFDSVFAFDRHLRPENQGITRYYGYRDQKCNYFAGDLNGGAAGDPLTDMTHCWNAVPALQVLDGGRENLWLSGVDQTKMFVQRIEPTSNSLGARHRLPQEYSAVVPATARFSWAIQGSRIEVYDLDAFAPLVTDAVQPGPAFIRDVGTLIKRVHATLDPDSVLVSNDSRVLWLSAAANGDVVILATLERDAFLEDAALRAGAAELAVVSADQRRIDTYRIVAGQFEPVATTPVGGFQAVVGCETGFYAWRRLGDEQVVDRIDVNGGLQEWGRFPAVDRFQITCASDALITVGEAAEGKRLDVRGYALAASGEPLWAFDLPYVGGRAPDVVTVRVLGSLVVVHFRADLGGVFVYDTAVTPPEFVAADLSSTAAGLESVHARWINGQVWITGIDNNVDLGTRILVKAVND